MHSWIYMCIRTGKLIPSVRVNWWVSRPSAFLRCFHIELNDFCNFFLTILKKVCFIMEVSYQRAYFNPIRYVLVKLHTLNHWKTWNCLFTKLFGINTLVIHIKMPGAVPNILCLLIKIRDAVRANWIACVAIPSMQVVTWSQRNFQS